MAPNVCRKTSEDFCLEATPKKDLHDLCGRKFVGKSCTNTFRASLGKSGKKFSSPKKLPGPILMEAPLLKAQNDKIS